MPIRRVHLEGTGMWAGGETDVVEIPAPSRQFADDAGFGRADSASHSVIAWQLQSDDEFRAARRAQRHDEVPDVTCTPLPIAVIFIIAPNHSLG
jgi:hypothetical protein